jgi:hypothetical protein
MNSLWGGMSSRGRLPSGHGRHSLPQEGGL